MTSECVNEVQLRTENINISHSIGITSLWHTFSARKNRPQRPYIEEALARLDVVVGIDSDFTSHEFVGLPGRIAKRKKNCPPRDVVFSATLPRYVRLFRRFRHVDHRSATLRERCLIGEHDALIRRATIVRSDDE